MKSNIEDSFTLEDSICIKCKWNDMIHDEMGVIDYCTKRDIYADKMEGIIKCLYFYNNKDEMKK